MKFEFIRDNELRFGIDEMCSALEVSRSGYYSWKEGRLSARSLADQVAKKAIKAVFGQSRGRYGYRPIHGHLKEDGVDCGRDRTLRLMRELGLRGAQASRFKPVGTDSDHSFGYSPNLLSQREMPQTKDEVWVADTTYLPTKKGWRYFATVMDLGTRRIIGWSITHKNDSELVCAALAGGLIARAPMGGNVQAPTSTNN